jgi:PPOX class probable F420-dependent enzyme
MYGTAIIYYNDMVRRPDISLTPSEVRELLANHRTGVLATNGRDGFPHQVAMWYLPEPDRLLMWTYRKAQKAVNLRRDPRASFLVETNSSSYDELQGVHVQGPVDLLDDPEQVLEVGVRLRLRHHPGVDPQAAREYIARQAAKRVVLVLRMETTVSWDHRKLAR